MIAALFVETSGVYAGLRNVDLWDQARDARLYRGPHRCIAHPPCERWGDFAKGQPGNQIYQVGDDGGCFESAIASVRTYGGVLEHPAGSRAWAAFGLFAPPVGGGWIWADSHGWTCHIEQGHYGHRAPKPTWLYLVGSAPPSLKWGKSRAPGRIERMGRYERKATPVPFRDLLLSMIGYEAQ